MTRSTIRADVGVAIVPQTISRHLAEANIKSKRPFRALPLTPEHRQQRQQWCQAKSTWNVTDWQKVVFSDESRTFPKWSPRGKIFQQDNARPHTARVAQDFLRHFQTLPWPTPDLSPVELVWDQLKRQKPSCHSVHDLELAVQDLWAHLPQDNIRCLINSMPNRVVACIAAGGGPTRYRSCPVLVSLHTLLHAEIVEEEIEVVSPSIVPSGNFAELNRTVTCMVLKANDRRTSCPCHDEFRGPRSDYVRQVALENNNNNVVLSDADKIQIISTLMLILQRKIKSKVFDFAQ
ncbi:transposable element Tcb2 transposase [Trichonephila clavipes]|nr:transposable element Tcb2 transposase [Trichonephila clavipes]